MNRDRYGDVPKMSIGSPRPLVNVDPPAVPGDPERRVARDERRHLLGQLPRPQRDVAHVVQDQVLRPPVEYQ